MSVNFFMKRLLGWFVDDWVPFKSFDARWNLHTEFGLIIEECGYQFVYSPYQDRCKLRCWGYKPKDHKMYWYAKQQFEIFKIKYNYKKQRPMENSCNGGTTLVALKTRY